MTFPIYTEHCRGIPINQHLGAFGVIRKHDVHTGVDLYTSGRMPVLAPVSGKIIKVGPFTGPDAESDWWLPTKAVAILSQNVVYVCGEIDTHLKEGDIVTNREKIGHIAPVLPKEKFRLDIPGHSCHMLHFEIMDHAHWNGWPEWKLGEPCPKGLVDPTPFLIEYLSRERRMHLFLSYPQWIDHAPSPV